MHWKEVKPSVKYHIIQQNTNRYGISVMCRFFDVSRSGYYRYPRQLEKPNKDVFLSEQIAICQERCGKTYGYRRVQIWLEKRGVARNPKTVLRVMRKYGLLSEVRRRRRWRQLGEQVHKYENLLNYSNKNSTLLIEGTIFNKYFMGQKKVISKGYTLEVVS